MKVTPVASPGQIQDTSTPEHVRTAKAVAAFNKGQASFEQPSQEVPQVNANSVSPEELSAVQPPREAQQPEITNNITEETPAEVTSEVKDPELERRFQQIARQERALRAKAQQQAKSFNDRESALKAREAALEAKGQGPDMSQYIPRARLQEDALGVLEAEGIATYDTLTERAMNRQPVDPMIRSTIEALRSEINALKSANETNQKSQQEQNTANYQAAIKQITTDARNLITNDPEFETVKAMNATKDVVELIEETYKKDGVVLSVEEAAKEVENYLVEEAFKITQIDKIKRRMAAANASQLKSEVKTQAPQQTQMKTLTNATSSTRPLTARERAIAAAEGRLKS